MVELAGEGSMVVAVAVDVAVGFIGFGATIRLYFDLMTILL